MKNKAFIVLALCSLLLAPMQAQELLNYPLDTIDGEEVYRYQVERSIGLYRISVNFNVSQNDIVRLNPQLRERGLHFDETLLIPTGRPVVIESKPRVMETEVTVTTIYSADSAVTVRGNEEMLRPAADTVRPAADTVRPAVDTVRPAVDTVVVSDTTAVTDARRVVELALMLPFESKQAKRSGNAERMMEMYQGALLALRDLQNDSTLYRLRVYDTERSELRVKTLCDSTELDRVQGVLGLIYPIQIERMAEWCDVHEVPLIVPFSDDVNLGVHPQVLQFNASDAQEADSLCRWLLAQEAIHMVTVDVKDAELASSVRALRRQIKANGIESSLLPLHDLMVDSCTSALDAEKENVFVLPSDRYQNIRMLLPHLTKLREQGYRIRLVSQYSWQKEDIDLPQVYTTMFKQESNTETYDALWSKYYVTQHVSEAPRYDLLGYDLMTALVQWVNGDRAAVRGLQSDIRWTQVNGGGWQNAGLTIRE